MQTESELLWLGFRFFGPSPLPLACGRMQTPTPTPTISTPPQYLLPLPCIAVCHGTPETEPPCLVFGFLGPSPLPWLAFVNAQLHHQNHIIHTSPEPPPITLHCRLPRHTRNPATTLSFRVLGPSPLSWLVFPNAQSHHHHYLIHTMPPPPPITLHYLLPQHTQN